MIEPLSFHSNENCLLSNVPESVLNFEQARKIPPRALTGSLANNKLPNYRPRLGQGVNPRKAGPSSYQANYLYQRERMWVGSGKEDLGSSPGCVLTSFSEDTKKGKTSCIHRHLRVSEANGKSKSDRCPFGRSVCH